MSNLNDEYQKIMSDIEKNITDEKQLQYVKNKMAELTVLFINTVDKVVEYSEEKLSNMEEKQQDLEERLVVLQKKIESMEKDFYEDENEFEFEVVCPYCNHQFVTDIDLESNSEIKCPECKNIIELDWNEDDELEENECTGSCHGCSGCNINGKNDFKQKLEELEKLEKLNEAEEIEIDLDDDEDDM